MILFDFLVGMAMIFWVAKISPMPTSSLLVQGQIRHAKPAQVPVLARIAAVAGLRSK